MAKTPRKNQKHLGRKPAGAWWLEPEMNEHTMAAAWVNSCRKGLSKYRDDVLYWMSLYNGSEDLTGTGSLTMRATGNSKLRYNLVSSICETAQSVVGAARTLPYHLPRGGNWSIQRKCKRRTAAIQAQFQDLKLFSLGAQAITDGIVGALGVTYFFVDPDTNLPGAERVLPLELAWDPAEAMGGEVRTFSRSKPVSREVLKAIWPDFATEIDLAKGPSATDLKDFALTRDGFANQAVLHEVWHLPSKKDATDGRHVVFLDNVTLFSEPWKRPRFPFAIYRWAPRQFGFVGKSLVAEVEPAQKRVENLIKYIEECQDLGSKPQVWIHEGAKVEPAQIDNVPMSVNRYSGPPGAVPHFFTFDATPHDLEASVDKIRERAMSQLGLSTQQINGEKPAGVTSAVGMRTLEDISSKRHVINIRQVEDYYLQCAQCLADINDEIAENEADFSIDRRVRGRFLESTKWSECMLKEGEMRMTVYPISSLPPTPTGQLEGIESWIQGGYVERDAGMQLLGMPDTEAFTALETADRNFVAYQAEQIMEGKRVSPEQYANLDIALVQMRQHYLNAKTDGAPEPVLNNFRYFLDQAKRKKEAAVASGMNAPHGPINLSQAENPDAAMQAPPPMA